MVIALYLKSGLIQQQITGILTEHKIKTFKTFLNLYTEIITKNKRFDLIIADIALQQANKSLQQQLSQNRKPVPVIFYNDPYPEESERIWYWQKQNSNVLDANKFTDSAYEYNKIFSSMHNFLMRENIFPKSNSLLKDGIPPTITWLFSYFYENMQREIDSAEIIDFLLEKSSKPIKPQCVYAYISRLKNMIEQKFPDLAIIRSRRQTYMMIKV